MEGRDQKTKKLAEAIRNILVARGISSDEFALLINKDRREVELWLNGMHSFSLRSLFHISERLGLLQ